MDVDKATRLVEEASSSSAPSSAATNDATIALAWLQSGAGAGDVRILRHTRRLALPLARLIAGKGLGAPAPSSAAVRANAAGLVAALAAAAEDLSALQALDAAASRPLAQAVADAACPPPPPEEGAAKAAPTSRALQVNAMQALSLLCAFDGAARGLCLGRGPVGDDGPSLLLPALLAFALGVGEEPEDGGDKGDLPPKSDLEVRGAAANALLSAASAGPGGADGGPRRALVAAAAPAVAARVLIVAGAAAEQEQEAAVVAAAAADVAPIAEGGRQGGAGEQQRKQQQERQQERQQQRQRRAPREEPAPPQETPETELRMRCLLLLGILCGGGGGGKEDADAAARRSARRQLAREPGAIAALMASVRLGRADQQAAGVARALLSGLRRDGELAPLVEAAVRQAVEAAAAAVPSPPPPPPA